MIKDSVVPISPSLLPQQRLYEVKTLPEWPSCQTASKIDPGSACNIDPLTAMS